MEPDLQAQLPDSSVRQAVDDTELTNDVVTVSRLQVALRSRAKRLQMKFSDIALRANTATPEGLFELLQETASVLLENSDFWSHVVAGSQTVDSRQEGEALFNQFSLQERAKFSAETLTNVNGVVTQQPPVDGVDTQQPTAPDRSGNHPADDHPADDRPAYDRPAYIVVTLLLGTANDEPLFKEIYSTSLLRDVLGDITLLQSGLLLAFELLWTPQDPIDSLTDADLAANYADLMPIA
jgi:uncharacterized membrane protein